MCLCVAIPEAQPSQPVIVSQTWTFSYHHRKKCTSSFFAISFTVSLNCLRAVDGVIYQTNRTVVLSAFYPPVFLCAVTCEDGIFSIYFTLPPKPSCKYARAFHRDDWIVKRAEISRVEKPKGWQMRCPCWQSNRVVSSTQWSEWFCFGLQFRCHIIKLPTASVFAPICDIELRELLSRSFEYPRGTKAFYSFMPIWRISFLLAYGLHFDSDATLKLLNKSIRQSIDSGFVSEEYTYVPSYTNCCKHTMCAELVVGLSTLHAPTLSFVNSHVAHLRKIAQQTCCLI